MTGSDRGGAVDRISRVLVAGGGVAALESLLALRDLAGDRLELTLVAPSDEFVYRPMAVAEPFGLSHPERVPLQDVARDVGARLVRGSVVAVDESAHMVECASGERLPFDALVVAVGAQMAPPLEHAVTWTPESDPELLGGILRDVGEGYTTRVAFVVPLRPSWPLPAYELALMTAREAVAKGQDDVDVVVVTPEDAPLALFGTVASAAVADELARAGVRVEAGVIKVRSGSGFVTLEPGSRRLAVDRLVALPHLRGPHLVGLPYGFDGFIMVDEHGRVGGASRAWAAGDATSFPIKQGGLAAEQADAVAEDIAALAGAPVEPHPFRPVLRGLLLTGDTTRWMRHDVAGGHGEGVTASHALWWPPTKIAGRYLSRYLAERSEAGLLEGRAPSGLPVELDLERELAMLDRPAS